MDWQWMRHPQTGGVQRFAAPAVEAWQAAGWEPCDEPTPVNLAVGAPGPVTEPTETPAPAEPPAEATKNSRRASADTRKE
jgi:hypothetical protein